MSWRRPERKFLCASEVFARIVFCIPKNIINKQNIVIFYRIKRLGLVKNHYKINIYRDYIKGTGREQQRGQSATRQQKLPYP